MSFNFGSSFDRSGKTSGVTSALAPPLSPIDGELPHTNRQPNARRESSTTQVGDEQPVSELARQLTRHTTRHSFSAGSPFNPVKDSELDPYGPNFNGRKWYQRMLAIAEEDGHSPIRRSGIAFRNLSVHGMAGGDADYQQTVGTLPFAVGGFMKTIFGGSKTEVQILNNFDGFLESGEMLVVLGPPGSGCSTLLKTIAGEMDGIFVSDESYINYRGISAKHMRKNFRGEAIYSAEVDVHFPSLTVGDTLTFAANARAPRHPPAGLSKKQFAQHMRDVAMSLLGISHTVNTRVGNDFVRGVSGGERKRVSIAEAMLSGAPLQCWDNSTRGLDSANAIEFCKTLRTSTQLVGAAAVVAIYQAPQSAYDIFDKVVVLYEGECIYFGPTTAAKQFFLDMGFECPEQQTTPDFLTSLTSPAERTPRQGWENKVPKTPKEFAAAWKASSTYKELVQQLDNYDKTYPIGQQHLEEFKQSRRAQQSKKLRPASPYTLSYGGQVKLCLRRGFQRLKADPSLTVTQAFGNTILALIISSVFYNLQPVTSSFYQRGALLFFAVLMNAFSSALEILTLYAQRPIVEKHARYALYHPSAEAVASMLTDLPYKVVNAITFNLTLYFMSNLRREPGPFFFFLLVSFTATLVMSMVFRSIASLSRTLSQALAPAAVLILALVIYTGFTIPTRYMLGWSRWINYLDPLGYAFESIMVNEFTGRSFTCSQLVPSGPGYNDLANQICSTTGAIAGQQYVNGDDYLASSFQYYASNKWRNYGIMWAFLVFQCAVYLVAAELVSAKKSKGEVLVFPRGAIPKSLRVESGGKADEEAGSGGNVTTSEKLESGKKHQKKKNGVNASIIQRQTAIFQWQDVCYDIKIKGEPRRILDHVDGWVKPGTMTALMGVSGAGKTTLLDCLATRVTMGVVTGEMLVDGRQRDQSFQRKTGYVQQQDLHLQTSTVREALRFSAILRQPAHVPHQEKLDYVEEVLELLEMSEYADAVVGVPGEGLNVEQRKRLTIGVELVAKPELLLFLDEPTSGLDSQTSWSIIELLTKLTKHGQAILCTIHQPSAILFERFDRLLFLAKGGKTIYFGPLGEKSHFVTEYFEKNGGYPCPKGENPAEWMLSVIGAAPGSHTDIDWHQAWLNSEERQSVRQELAQMKSELANKEKPKSEVDDNPKLAKAQYKEFAAPFGVQMWEVLHRCFQQYWRTPSYIFSKIVLCAASALFIGFSFFKAPVSLQGLQNQLFSVFMLFTIFGQLVQQIMPNFVVQRSLYEVRERPAKTYSWKVFMLSNIIVELPWNSLMAVIIFFCWYYPVGFYNNAALTNTVNERGALFFLLVWSFLLFTSTFATMVIAGIDTAETGGNIANLMFSLCLVFCGVLASQSSLPRFWIFMYRLSPFTYLVGGMLGTGIGDANIVCADNELLQFSAPAGQTCGQYVQPYMAAYGGYLQDDATSSCSFCSASSTNVFLASFDIYPSQKWRNFGIMWAFIGFNIVAALVIYWLARVPKNQKLEETASSDTDNTTQPQSEKVQKRVSN